MRVHWLIAVTTLCRRRQGYGSFRFLENSKTGSPRPGSIHSVRVDTRSIDLAPVRSQLKRILFAGTIPDVRYVSRPWKYWRNWKNRIGQTRTLFEGNNCSGGAYLHFGPIRLEFVAVPVRDGRHGEAKMRTRRASDHSKSGQCSPRRVFMEACGTTALHLAVFACECSQWDDFWFTQLRQARVANWKKFFRHRLSLGSRRHCFDLLEGRSQTLRVVLAATPFTSPNRKSALPVWTSISIRTS